MQKLNFLSAYFKKISRPLSNISKSMKSMGRAWNTIHCSTKGVGAV
jgi:hypothetical protein